MFVMRWFPQALAFIWGFGIAFATEELDQCMLIQTVKAAQTSKDRMQRDPASIGASLKCEQATGGSCTFAGCDSSRGPTECKKNGLVTSACFCKEGYCNIAGRCVYSEEFDLAPASPGTFGPAAFFIKCWFATHDQQASLTSGDRASWDEFEWAKDGDWQNKHVVITGEFELISDLVKVTGWNLEGTPSSKVLAQKCQATLDTMPVDKASRPFLYGFSVGAPNCTQDAECQGLDYTVPGWGPLFGPMLTFPEEGSKGDASHVKSWVTFGDSLSDIGNFMWYAFKFPMSPYYLGHFSNGWIWQEHLATALNQDYEASENGIMNPPTGFVSYARGGSTTNVLLANGALKKYHAEDHLNVTAFEHMQVGVTGVLTGDLWNFLWLADQYALKMGDPYTVILGNECTEHGAPCGDGALCVGTRCINPASHGKCEIFTCTCQDGLHNRNGKCVAATPPAMEGPGPLGFVWTGANDLMGPAGLSSVNEYFDDDSAGFMGYKQVVSSGILNVKLFLDALYRRGYKTFAVPNMPNLGKIPMNVVKPNVVNAAFAPGGDVNASDDLKQIKGSQEMTKISKAWNVAIKEMLDKWGGSHSDVKLVQLDFFSWLENMLATNPDDFNMSFNETVTAGTETMTIQKRCMSTSKIPVTQVGWLGPGEVCSNQENVVFWDNCHPTTRSQCFMASFFHKELAKEGLLPPPDMVKYDAMCKRDDIAWNGHSIHTGAYIPPSTPQRIIDSLKLVVSPEAWKMAFSSVQNYIVGLVNDPHHVFLYAQTFWDTVINVIQGFVPGTEKL
eukprot:TRINITY_DN5479_c0_g1_i1.p1 TRINITY_DN5479_c0_g1~~TRINITY_DN5479_c0_g1_i1.p1  ORF type:complete len:786 (-),score=114.85 TRINITY_DN5479_c0_g1_i1:49-2406(-)